MKKERDCKKYLKLNDIYNEISKPNCQEKIMQDANLNQINNKNNEYCQNLIKNHSASKQQTLLNKINGLNSYDFISYP